MNLGQLRTSIQAKGYGTDTVTAQNDMINSYYRRICARRRWWFLEAQGTLNAAVGDSDYNFSGLTDFGFVDAVRATFGTETFDLVPLPLQAFRTYQHNVKGNSRPIYWTRRNAELLITPAPDKAYVLTVDFIKDPPDLTSDSNTPVLPDAFHDVLVWGAIREMCFRQRDAEGWSLANAEVDALVRDMDLQDSFEQRQGTSEVGRTHELDRVNDEILGAYQWLR